MRLGWTIMIGGLACLVLMGCAPAGAPITPQEIDECVAPTGFAGEPLTPEKGTAFSVRGYSPTGFESDPRYEVSWCQTGPGLYALVIRRDGHLFHPSCPARIEWDYSPYGLRVKNEPMPLKLFTPMNEGEDVDIPAGTQTSASALQDGNASVERYFYCYEGRWLLAVYH